MTSPTAGAPPPPPAYVGTDPPSRGGRLRVGAVAVGVVAVLAAGVFAAVALSGKDGSASPEEAVERLFEAVSDEDVLGILEALPPAERSALRPGLEDVTGELRRLGILSDDVDLESVGGVDLEIEGVELAAEELGEGVTAVRLTGGTLTTSTEPEQLPLGSALRNLFEGPEGSDLEEGGGTHALGDDGPVLVTVQEDGGWHVSLFYSVAEAFRGDAGEAVPTFGQGVEPAGADSPEDVVRQVAEAAVALDARRLVALTPPGEMGALHDYAPLFLDQADQAEAPFEVRIDRLDLEPEVDGDVARVRLTGFAASVGSPDMGNFSVSYDGDCMVFVADGVEERTCASDMAQTGAPVSSELVLSTVRHDDQWYLSPTRTVFEQLLGTLRALEPEDVEDLGSLFSEMPPLFPGFPPFGPPPPEATLVEPPGG